MLSILLACLLVSTVFGTVSALHPTSFSCFTKFLCRLSHLTLYIACGEMILVPVHPCIYAHGLLCFST